MKSSHLGNSIGRVGQVKFIDDIDLVIGIYTKDQNCRQNVKTVTQSPGLTSRKQKSVCLGDVALPRLPVFGGNGSFL